MSTLQSSPLVASTSGVSTHSSCSKSALIRGCSDDRPETDAKRHRLWSAAPLGQQDSIGDSLDNVSTEASEDSNCEEGADIFPESLTHFKAFDSHPGYKIFDVDMFGEGMMKKSLEHYYDCCKDYRCRHGNLLITTSCFEIWRQAKKTNVTGKIIPAVPASSFEKGSGGATRVFFFDDNLNLHLGGASDVEGICNLRDICTGEFVDFSVGKNGFRADHLFGHTCVHHSSEYNSVLIQANIVDAMANDDYFLKIIQRYSKPGEKVILIADVNGVTLCEDTLCGKDVSSILLTTMFRFVEVRVNNGDKPFDFVWQSEPAVSVSKTEDLKSLVNRIFRGDRARNEEFWKPEGCERFLREIASVAEVAWCDRGMLQPQEFMDRYRNALQNSGVEQGVPKSWFNCFNVMVEKGHTVVLNSFGVDSLRVASQMVSDVEQVLQLTVNYDSWSARDTEKWNAQLAK